MSERARQFGAKKAVKEHKSRKAPGEGSRGNSTARGYNWPWRRARVQYLNEHPLCEACYAQGFRREATVVDHKIPHRGNQSLFWDEGNWCALCAPCHNSKTGKGE